MPIEDYFLDEYLFFVSTHSSWNEDIANYIVAGIFPQYLSSI